MTDFEFSRLEQTEEEIDNFGVLRERTLFVSIAEQFYDLYRFFSGTDFVRNYDDRMKAANISRDSDVFLSGVFGVGTIMGGIVGLLALLLTQLGFAILPGTIFSFAWYPLPEAVLEILNPLSFIVSIAFIGFVGAFIGLSLGVICAAIYPWMIARRRRREIGLVLPDAVSFLYAISAGGGMTQMDLFRAVADSEDVFGELAVEFQRVMVNVDGFNDDFQTAVAEVADTTPNEDLQMFLTEMLSRINSGASMVDYLEEAMEDQRRTRQRKLETILDLLDLVGQMYMTLNFAPMLLVIILVMMSLTGDPRIWMLMGTIYIIQPLVNAMYGSFISSVDEDSPGDGYIRAEDGSIPGKQEENILSLGPIDNYSSDPVFRQIRRNEYFYNILDVLRNPFEYLFSKPRYLFIITVPASLLFMVLLTLEGALSPTKDAFLENMVSQMLGYFFVPFYLIVLPYTIAFEWQQHTRQKITDTLSEDLRRLSNINATDKPLTEALEIVYEDSDSKLSEEFGIMHAKLQLGIPLDQSLIEFNNKYYIPRLGRMVKILERAQEVSDHIEDVLETAAQTAQYQQRIEKDRYMRMLMQVIVIEMSFLVFLGILAAMNGYLVERVVAVIGDGPAWGNFEKVDPNVINILFFHSVIIQGITSGILAGYVQTNSVKRGLKYALLNATLALFVWMILPYINF